MKMYKLSSFFLLALLLISISACSDLEETLNEDLTAEEAQILLDGTDVDALILTAYESMFSPFQDQARYFCLQEHTSDEVIGPTRGPDWDDNGIWRVLHNHSWDADHLYVGDTFNELLQGVFNATNILNFDPSPEQGAEARFLRAFFMYCVSDTWGQVPVREPGEDLLNAPRVLKGSEANDFIISELEEIMPNLPDGKPDAAGRATKEAAKALLMKAYINRGVYADRARPSFDNADMDKVIQYADEITANGSYSLADNYYDNFAINNGEVSPELIFTSKNTGGERGGNVRSRWYMTLHYNQNPSGWNGFCTIADFYDKFTDDNDTRKSGEIPLQIDSSGIKMGFLEGQQVDQDGNDILDRKGNPLSYTREVAIQESGNNLEVTGVRAIKYQIDYESGDLADNDFVIYRYADVLLMKAEALMRKGDNGAALAIVNEIRAKRGAAELTSLDEQAMLDERGFELWWEGHRRQDLIRFGKFLDAWNEKPESGAERLVFPIPNAALAVNPNLEQNPGY
ncbi:MAG: RagB/SusD family nutrient uptake outer membrane protein [Bacteroidota bacterium]